MSTFRAEIINRKISFRFLWVGMGPMHKPSQPISLGKGKPRGGAPEGYRSERLRFRFSYGSVLGRCKSHVGRYRSDRRSQGEGQQVAIFDRSGRYLFWTTRMNFQGGHPEPIQEFSGQVRAGKARARGGKKRVAGPKGSIRELPVISWPPLFASWGPDR